MDNLESRRKYNEYKMKLIKMAGVLSDFYIDRAIESNDFSEIQGLLIEYFFEHSTWQLVQEYNDNELNKKVEDIDVNLGEWERLKYDIFNSSTKEFRSGTQQMNQDQYIEAMVEKRKELATQVDDTDSTVKLNKEKTPRRQKNKHKDDNS